MERLFQPIEDDSSGLNSTFGEHRRKGLWSEYNAEDIDSSASAFDEQRDNAVDYPASCSPPLSRYNLIM